MPKQQTTFIIDKKEQLGEHEDDKPPPDLCVLPISRSSGMVSRIISNVVYNQAKQSLSTIDSLYRKFGGTFGIQELY